MGFKSACKAFIQPINRTVFIMYGVVMAIKWLCVSTHVESSSG